MREYLRHLKIYFFIGIIIFSLFAYARVKLLVTHNILLEEVNLTVALLFYTTIISIGAISLGSIMSLIDVFLISRIMYKKSMSFVLITSIILNSIVIFYIYHGMNIFAESILPFFSENIDRPAKDETSIWIVFLVFHVSLSRLVIEVDKKLGPGNLWKMMTGKFYKPREENRIFMFVDLKGSTTIAEKIGHKKYSLLLQECFRDFSVVARYNAKVYQYVGDEVVISWRAENKNYIQFLHAFFAFKNVLQKRKEYYKKTYGLMPIFKAGANSGPVIVTEVGEIKREITYHGDTLNTAARIQGKCNEFCSNMLISESLYNIVKSNAHYTFEDVGCIELKGKEEEVKLFKVTEK